MRGGGRVRYELTAGHVQDRTGRTIPRSLRDALAAAGDAAETERAALSEAEVATRRLRSAVQEAVSAGASWSVIADVVGVTRAAAHRRFSADRLI